MRMTAPDFAISSVCAMLVKLIVTLVLGISVALPPGPLSAQDASGPEMHLRVGWWMPTGAIPVREFPDYEPPHGEVALGQTLLVGAMAVWPLRGRFSLRVGADVGLPRPVPRLAGEACTLEQTRGHVDGDCRARCFPRGWLAQGRVELHAQVSGPISLGVGLAPRVFSADTGNCQNSLSCSAAGDIQRQPGFTVGLQGTALIRRAIAGRTLEVQLSNTTIRVEDRFQHEILLGLGIPVGWWRWCRTPGCE